MSSQQNAMWYQMYGLSVRGELGGRVLEMVLRVPSGRVHFSLNRDTGNTHYTS